METKKLLVEIVCRFWKLGNWKLGNWESATSSTTGVNRHGRLLLSYFDSTS